MAMTVPLDKAPLFYRSLNSDVIVVGWLAGWLAGLDWTGHWTKAVSCSACRTPPRLKIVDNL